jgi:hypothetical protein
MKDKLRRWISCLAVATAGMAAVSNASAYFGDEDNGLITNSTNGCVRAYVAGGRVDIPPHAQRFVWTNPRNPYFMVDVFKWSTCGGKAVRNVWFRASDHYWTVR